MNELNQGLQKPNDQVKWAAEPSPQSQETAETPLHLNDLFATFVTGDGKPRKPPRPRMKPQEMSNLREWHPGYLDLTNPFDVLHGKTITKTEWMPGGVTFYFDDGTTGEICILMDRNKFGTKDENGNYIIGPMITKGELYLYAGLRNSDNFEPTKHFSW